MLSRATIADDYDVNEHGTIVSPGKFEGEPYYLVGLYDLILDGASDETNGPADLITVDADLRAAYPEIDPTTVAFVVWTSDTGFCNLAAFETLADAESALAEFGDDDDDDDTADDDDDTPQPEDLVTSDHRKFYEHEGTGRLQFQLVETESGEFILYPRPGVSVAGGPYATIELAIRAYCDAVQFWPGVWFVSDHGNAHRIDL